MRITQITAVLVLSFLHARPVLAQKADSVLSVLSSQHVAEKVYIHYDKEYYVAGETIWFKAYFYSNGRPSGLSNNFYLQLINNKGQVISEGRYPVFGAVTKGAVHIPDSLPQGSYMIRALTPGMMNYDEAMIYKKSITVFRSGTPANASPREPQTVSVSFFPESGHLVDGILSVMAFKATDQWGTPVEVNGVVKTVEGTTIAGFKTYHDGIGKVQFKPQAGKKYTAEVETPAGMRSYPLPEVQASGVNLKVQDEKGGKKFQLSRSEKGKELFSKLILLVEINNNVIYENEIVFDDYPSVIGHLVTDSLPSGILHFTVFNSDGVPLAERLSFVNNGEYRADATIHAVKVSTEKRGWNNLELEFPIPLQRSCSVSIIDMPVYSFNDEDDIISRLLLTGELKGYIHNPVYYFRNQTDSAKQALDNLMLTHGWSRFNWTRLLSGEFPAKKYKDEALLSVSGFVVDAKTKERMNGGKLNIFLEAEDSSSQNLEAAVGADGSFKIDSVGFMGKGQFFYAYIDSKEKAKPALVQLDENKQEKAICFIPAGITGEMISRNPGSLQNKSEVDQRAGFVLVDPGQVKELQNVDIKSKASKKPVEVVSEQYTSGAFKEMGKVNLDNVNEPANDKSLSVVDHIRNRIQQVEIQNGRFVNRKNISLMTGQKWVVGLFLNEQPVDMTFLRNIRVKDVALVKFYDAGWVGVGSSTPGGAIAVYTKERFMEAEKPDKLEYWEYKGYTITKQFYHPDYSMADVKQPASDNRTTLYWNPDIITDTETKSVKLNFYNNDFSKKFKVIVEGFDASGKLVHLEKVISN